MKHFRTSSQKLLSHKVKVIVAKKKMTETCDMVDQQ